MPTYADYAAERERAARKAAQDQHLARLTRQFDLSAQDTHMKYERPQFAVVTASAAFREGYDQICWRGAPSVSAPAPASPGPPRVTSANPKGAA